MFGLQNFIFENKLTRNELLNYSSKSKNNKKFKISIYRNHSFELVENTAKYFNDHDAVLMANHGFIVGSATMEDAYLKLELAESYAQVVLNTELLGGAKYLSEEQEKEILELRKKL